GATGNGGAVAITGGAAASTNGNGGGITITTGTTTGSGTPGTVVVKPGTLGNSATFFQVQNAAATPILNVDTSNSRVGINTAAPTADLSFGTGTNRTINVITQTTSNTAGNNLTVQSATGNGTGAGGALTLQAGNSG